MPSGNLQYIKSRFSSQPNPNQKSKYYTEEEVEKYSRGYINLYHDSSSESSSFGFHAYRNNFPRGLVFFAHLAERGRKSPFFQETYRFKVYARIAA